MEYEPLHGADGLRDDPIRISCVAEERRAQLPPVVRGGCADVEWGEGVEGGRCALRMAGEERECGNEREEARAGRTAGDLQRQNERDSAECSAKCCAVVTAAMAQPSVMRRIESNPQAHEA